MSQPARQWLALLLSLLLAPVAGWGQASVAGQVRDSLTHAPLPFASVFLANTTLGVTTTEQGRFLLDNVPAGTYDIVVSYVGYHLAKQPVVVGNMPLELLLLPQPAANRLGEVVVRPNPNRAADYQRFMELFLGRTTFAQQCRIRDPDNVLIDYDPAQNVLTASAYQFVQVDNQALSSHAKVIA